MRYIKKEPVHGRLFLYGGQTRSMLDYIKNLAEILKPVQIVNFESCYAMLDKHGLLVVF